MLGRLIICAAIAASALPQPGWAQAYRIVIVNRPDPQPAPIPPNTPEQDVACGEYLDLAPAPSPASASPLQTAAYPSWVSMRERAYLSSPAAVQVENGTCLLTVAEKRTMMVLKVPDPGLDEINAEMEATNRALAAQDVAGQPYDPR